MSAGGNGHRRDLPAVRPGATLVPDDARWRDVLAWHNAVQAERAAAAAVDLDARLRRLAAELGGEPILHYVLAEDGETPVPVTDPLTWARQAHAQRERGRFTVARHELVWPDGPAREPVRLATVFLGIDHGWFSSAPVLWETVIFGLEDLAEEDRPAWWDDPVLAIVAELRLPSYAQYQARYRNRAEALAGHDWVLRRLCALMGLPLPAGWPPPERGAGA